MQEVVSKIKAEMEKEKNPYVQVVGGFLLQHLDKNPHDAEKILVQDKTIQKSLEAMKKEAEKKKVGNCAVLTDAEGFAVVLKYFGIDGQVVVPEAPVPMATPSKTSSDFDVKLDDFL
jgi:excinuclease UvrABC nuclease subunit